MSFRIATIMMVVLLGSTSVFSAVTLQVPEEIKVVAINEQDLGLGILRANQDIKMDAGISIIQLRYHEFFQHEDHSHDILKSSIVDLTTPVLQENETYHLALINPPRNFEAAQLYKEQPIVGFYNAQNQLLAQYTGRKEKVKSWWSPSIEVKTTNLTQPTVITIPVSKEESVDARVTHQHMIQLWQKVSKTERQKFMMWLNQQIQ